MSVEEIIKEVVTIKNVSNELSGMTASSAQTLLQNNNQVMALVKGSRTGQDAVSAVSVAARSLQNAAAVIKILGTKCKNKIGLKNSLHYELESNISNLSREITEIQNTIVLLDELIAGESSFERGHITDNCIHASECLERAIRMLRKGQEYVRQLDTGDDER